MTKHVPLDNVDHAELKVAVRYGATFGDAVNQVLVFPTEFEQLQREYPIVFRRDERGAYYAVALLGIALDENLYLDETGWQARYVPAVRQRGPFIAPLAETSPEGVIAAPSIHVDLDDVRVGDEAGQPLYLRHGGQAPYLQHVERVLKAIQHGHEASGPMYSALEQLGLFHATSIEIDLGDGQSCLVEDVHLIAPDRLAALDASALEQLNRSGFLRAAFMAVASVENVGHLAALKQRRAAAA